MTWIILLNQHGSGSVQVQPLSGPLTAGKWYWEIVIPNASAGKLPSLTVRTGAYTAAQKPAANLGEAEGSYAWRADGSKWAANTPAYCGKAVDGDNDVVMTAADLTAGRIWFGINGIWFDGDPGKGRYYSFLVPNVPLVPAVSSTHGGGGTLQIFVPSLGSDYKYDPPERFTRLEPGRDEILPMPILLPPSETALGATLPDRSTLTRARAGMTTAIASALDRARSGGTVSSGQIANPEKSGRRDLKLYDRREDIFRAPIEPFVTDAPKRKALYQDLADRYFAKGNFYMAEKLLLHVEACDLADSDTQERLLWLRMLRASSASAEDTGEPESDRLFDFVYIPTEKCGSTAHLTLLSIHPDSTVPTNAETQVAFSEDRELGLLNHFRRRVFPYTRDLKCGLVMDARISGARQQPSGIVTGPEYARRLAKIVRPDGFFQAIRHPYGMIRSTYNSNIILYLFGGYDFGFINPATPFGGRRVLDVENFALGAADLVPVAARPEVDTKVLRAQMDFAARIPRPYSVGKAHADYFDRWGVIDLDLASRLKGPSRMVESYSAFGLDRDFTHPLDRFAHRDKTHFAMQRNTLKIRVMDLDLTVYLGRALQTVCTNDDEIVEILWTAPTEEAKDAGLRSPLCLAIHRNEWVPLPAETKRRLVESERLRTFFVDVMIPLWLHDYKIWIAALEPHIVGEFDEPLIRKIVEYSGREAVKFLKVHPQAEESWADFAARL